jgi:hypothetical protein
LEGVSGGDAQIFEEFKERYLDQVYADERGNTIFALRTVADP